MLDVVRHTASLVLFTAIALASCGPSTGGVSGGPALPSRGGATTASPIKHVIIVVQENRTFNDFFATFPGADGTTKGRVKNATGTGYTYVSLNEVNLNERCDFSHGYNGFLKNYDHGNMDGFVLTGNKCSGNHTAPYQYVDPSQIGPYWAIAKEYVLGEHMFQTQGSGSFTAHQDLIAGATIIDQSQTTSLVDFPSSTPWGCDAPQGTTTSELVWTGSAIDFKYGKGPFPCLTYETMRDLLDAKSVSWKYYSPSTVQGEGRLWNAFDAIQAVRYGKEWTTNVTQSETQIFKDISKKKLPAVSWVIPDRPNSDHPQSPSGDTGPSWVASIVNAVGTSAYWQSSAIVVVWDDWGGFYDNATPPFFDHWGGLGFRVPLLVVSPYAREAKSGKPGYISKTQYEFGSILKFVEETFDLGSLGTTDVRAKSIGDCFDFSQSPRTFYQISASHDKAYFLRRRPSLLPVDTE